jgi:hypothetical protein
MRIHEDERSILDRAGKSRNHHLGECAACHDGIRSST